MCGEVTVRPVGSTKAENDSDIWTPADSAPIREGAEQTERQSTER